MKTKMTLLASGTFEHFIRAEHNRIVVLKKRVYPVPKVGAVEALIQDALKQNENNTKLS